MTCEDTEVRIPGFRPLKEVASHPQSKLNAGFLEAAEEWLIHILLTKQLRRSQEAVSVLRYITSQSMML